jgi:hypothetical protein
MARRRTAIQRVPRGRSNDRARHQCDLRRDEADTKSRRAGIVERAGRRTALPHQCHPGGDAVRDRRAATRKNALTRALDGLLALFGDRVLPFDTDAARHDTALAFAAHNAGRGFPTPDGYIAWIAASRLHRRVTRHVTLRGQRALGCQPVAKLTRRRYPNPALIGALLRAPAHRWT